MIKAVVFDLDGVLVDAAEWHYQALNRALGLFGYSLTAEDHALNFNGLPTALKLNRLSQQRGLPQTLHGFINEMKQAYTRTILAEKCHVRPELVAMIEKLQARGLKIAVASNSARATVELVLERMAITDLFEVRASHEDVGAPKPSPDVYLYTFRKLALQPHECLIVEDSSPGIQAARASGAHVMTVRNPSEVTLERIEKELALIALDESTGDTEPTARTLEIVIPMAGLGSRFAAAGYDKPKPFIDVFGRPMIQWVIDNVRPSHVPYRFTFLCNEQHLRQYDTEAALTRVAPGCRIVSVPATTEGAACTMLLASDLLTPDWPLLIANSDQWVEFSIDTFLGDAVRTNCDGSILTFEASDKKWSYARLNEDGRVSEVAEKDPISPHATVGIYYFKRSQDFLEGAKEMIRRDIRTNGEFYVCPVYNEVIRAGRDVRIHDIPAASMHGLGTPEDLQQFQRWYLELR